ncbi:MAG TPA: STAS domain-containing protein [Jatrophihabitans sp.]|jgi:anti-sigma B factor antagonist|nr:STAS domain-containing protein [Jatrophihabitans sp.]
MVHIETTGCDQWRAAIALRGELDLANAPELRGELSRHLDTGRRVIRVDVGGVTFIDSTALSELINASERCHNEQGSLILTNVPMRVRRTIQICGLESVLLLDRATGGPGQSVAAGS